MARDRNEAINSYITDMLALEDHLEKALKGQIADLKEHPDVVTELRGLHRTVEHHLSDLRGLGERRDAGGLVEKVKRAGSAVAGLGAGLIDLVRTEGLPKNLRDDYTALSLATIGYVMLHITALSLDDREVAELAEQHFRDYAHAITRIHALVPEAVVRSLQAEGLPARDQALSEVRRTVEEVWGAQTGSVQRADASVGSRRS